jgi:hypothetical protein
MPGFTVCLIIFGSLEIGKHILIRPSLIPERGPFIKIIAATAHIGHGIGTAASAKCPPPGYINLPPIHEFLWLCPERPVNGRTVEFCIGTGNMYLRLSVRHTCLHKQDLFPGMRRKPVGDDASGGTCTDDDEVERCTVHQAVIADECTPKKRILP